MTHTNGVSITVSVENYLKYFKLRGRSKWQKNGENDNSTYVFDQPAVKVSYIKPDETYSGIVKSINFYEDNGKFYLGEIFFE
ncbi:MAG: hypothetical protein GY857_02920 [Desulfobacula sp.]|nr:hypothetical protein [Desulfobacula sp.]